MTNKSDWQFAVQRGRQTSQNPKTKSVFVKKQNRRTETTTNPETDTVTRTGGLMGWGRGRGAGADFSRSLSVHSCAYMSSESQNQGEINHNMGALASRTINMGHSKRDL